MSPVTMNLFEQITFLRQERYLDLTDWERNFIDELYDGIDGVAPGEDPTEYLTRGQIEKVVEIWHDLGM